MRSPNWKHTALFITYDEHGGYYDHVPPPAGGQAGLDHTDDQARQTGPAAMTATASASPSSSSHRGRGAATRRGSSRITHRCTAFIERKWNLPALTFRDANAHPMTDYFDFRKPAFARPPRLAAAPKLGPGLAECHAQGLTPPLPAARDGATTDVARYLAGR